MADWDTLAHSGQGGVRWPHWGMRKASVAAESRRQLQQTGARLLWWESPSRACGGRVWCVCVCGGGPTPCVSLSTGTSFPRQTMLPLGLFLVLEPLTPVSSVLSEQPTWSLPQICSQPESFSTVYTSTDLFSSPEGFNTQPPPALANSHLRQGGPGLIPKKALGQVALRTPEPTQTEEALQAMPTREIKESRTSFLSLMKPSFQDYLVEKS